MRSPTYNCTAYEYVANILRGIFVNLQKPGPDSQRPLTCGAMVMAGGDVVQGKEGECVRVEVSLETLGECQNSNLV